MKYDPDRETDDSIFEKIRLWNYHHYNSGSIERESQPGLAEFLLDLQKKDAARVRKIMEKHWNLTLPVDKGQESPETTRDASK